MLDRNNANCITNQAFNKLKTDNFTVRLRFRKRDIFWQQTNKIKLKSYSE